MLELSNKDFKAVITKMFQRAIMGMIKTNEKIASEKIYKVSAKKEMI